MRPKLIEEEEAMPEQPSAKARFTMSGMGLVVQGDIGGVQLALEQHLDASADADYINERLDMMTRAFWRQQAHPRLWEAMVDVKARRDALEKLPERELDYAKSRVEERARMVASWHAAHAVSKRAAFEFSRSQTQALADFDKATSDKQAEMAAEKIRIGKEIPLYEAQVARQRAVLAGADRSEVLDEAPLAQAAE